jgi:hypothetical protein
MKKYILFENTINYNKDYINNRKDFPRKSYNPRL